MKAISLWQPWATLIAIGAKQYETRSWKTNHRGLIAIHAAQTMNSEAWKLCKAEPINTLLKRAGYQSGRYSWRGCLPVGCLVAVAELVECLPICGICRGVPVREDRSFVTPLDISDQERALGDWTPGRFAWRLTNVRPVPPLYCRGHQGLWDLDPEIEAQLAAALGK